MLNDTDVTSVQPSVLERLLTAIERLDQAWEEDNNNRSYSETHDEVLARHKVAKSLGDVNGLAILLRKKTSDSSVQP